MKIAFAVHDFHRSGGHSRYVAELASRFARDHEVHVFANTFREESGITFHRVAASRANALALIFSFRRNAARMIAAGRFDIVHDQGLCCARPDVITAHIVNRAWLEARRAAPWKERLFGWIISALERRQYGRPEVIAVSERVRRDLAHWYGVRDRVTVVHHGVDCAVFSQGARAAGETQFLFVGDFRKGLEPAIRALERGRLTAVGSTPPGPYRDLARQLGREDRVVFHGATDEIQKHYAAADVLLLPTPYDAFGMVALEAMAAGLVVIVSEQAGASELIRDGENGLILRDASQLQALMERAAKSPHLGAAARETALEHSWDRVASETMAVYEKARQRPRVLAFATQGAGGNDESRLRGLLERTPADFFAFQYADKGASFRALLRELRKYDLAVMEGTGIAGGLALLVSRTPYVVSSGDAVGPFVAAKEPWSGWLFALYERLLCRRAHGFIGWSPYLAGRALTFGVKRAMTAAGWSSFQKPGDGARVRERFGISPEALVIGIAGSLEWNTRYGYCYGYELAQALALSRRQDLRILIVGGGSGRAQLETMKDERQILTGPVPREQIADYLAAMDIASLPQSCDGVGSFRYTTKLSEYIAAGVPVVTGQLPLAYDLGQGWMWRLAGDAPWDARYIRELAALFDRVNPREIAEKRAAVPVRPETFDRERQVERVTAFLADILSDIRVRA